MFRDIQIVIITNCVVVSGVGIKRVDCNNNERINYNKDDDSVRPKEPQALQLRD